MDEVDEDKDEKKKEVEEPIKGDENNRWCCRKRTDMTKKGKVNEGEAIDSFYQLPQDSVHEEKVEMFSGDVKVDSDGVGKYTHQNYLIDTAIRFYLMNVTSIEINQ